MNPLWNRRRQRAYVRQVAVACTGVSLRAHVRIRVRWAEVGAVVGAGVLGVAYLVSTAGRLSSAW